MSHHQPAISKISAALVNLAMPSCLLFLMISFQETFVWPIDDIGHNWPYHFFKYIFFIDFWTHDFLGFPLFSLGPHVTLSKYKLHGATLQLNILQCHSAQPLWKPKSFLPYMSPWAVGYHCLSDSIYSLSHYTAQAHFCLFVFALVVLYGWNVPASHSVISKCSIFLFLMAL